MHIHLYTSVYIPRAGQPFHIKGVSWFGAETEQHIPHYLWGKSADFFVNFLADNKFNVVRLPFSFMMLKDQSKANVDCSSNPDLCGKSPMDVIEILIDKFAKRGILVVVDFHSLEDSKIAALWYQDPNFPEIHVFRAWDAFMNRFKRKWNFFGMDLKNEPWGATWGKGNVSTDFNRYAERLIRFTGFRHPEFKGLFFVEGVAELAETPYPNSWGHFWGENLEGVHRFPIKTGNADLDRRIVYTPHVYGPDVFKMPYFDHEKFPENMPEVWNAHFGFVPAASGRALIIGEWGGKYATGSKDRIWQDAFAAYLKASGRPGRRSV